MSSSSRVADLEAGLLSFGNGPLTEATPLLRSRRGSFDSVESSESSISSSTDSSGGDYVPWYFTDSLQVTQTAASTPATTTATEEVGSIASPKNEGAPSNSIVKVVLILILGSFTANADGSLVLATHATIASEFNALSTSSWIFISFSLAGAATQAATGKLSDVYGRRALLVASFLLFAIGCGTLGIANSMMQVILGRVVSGVGGSGLMVLAMLIITDLVPLREAATWQSYLNLASTTGRSLGAPVGGWLADAVGWRWSFLSQVPIFLLAVALSALWLRPQTFSARGAPPGEDEPSSDDKSSRLARIDFAGAVLLAVTMISFLLPFELGGTKIPWTHPLIPGLLVAAFAFGVLFFLVESRLAKEPIFPVHLLTSRNIVAGYLISAAQAAAQLGLMYSIPLYFQVTQRASTTRAGAYLFPAVAGNAIGAITTGVLIKRTGRYKRILVVSTFFAATSYLLLFLFWHGDTKAWEILYTVPGGVGMGAVQTATFIAIQATTDPKDKAPALSGIWLTGGVGIILGMTGSSAVTIEIMGSKLASSLTSLGYQESLVKQIVQKSASSIDYLDEADSIVGPLVARSYVSGLAASHLVSLAFSAIAIISAISLREKKI
ncbi:major facilitator superfamily protein [Sarocladium implicatum]|nr:major facilitator superfamily protein [Sarocladium implicatum]